MNDEKIIDVFLAFCKNEGINNKATYYHYVMLLCFSVSFAIFSVLGFLLNSLYYDDLVYFGILIILFSLCYKATNKNRIVYREKIAQIGESQVSRFDLLLQQSNLQCTHPQLKSILIHIGHSSTVIRNKFLAKTVMFFLFFVVAVGCFMNVMDAFQHIPLTPPTARLSMMLGTLSLISLVCLYGLKQCKTKAMRCMSNRTALNTLLVMRLLSNTPKKQDASTCSCNRHGASDQCSCGGNCQCNQATSSAQ